MGDNRLACGQLPPMQRHQRMGCKVGALSWLRVTDHLISPPFSIVQVSLVVSPCAVQHTGVLL